MAYRRDLSSGFGPSARHGCGRTIAGGSGRCVRAQVGPETFSAACPGFCQIRDPVRATLNCVRARRPSALCAFACLPLTAWGGQDDLAVET